jgi:hypothetical protein
MVVDYEEKSKIIPQKLFKEFKFLGNRIAKGGGCTVRTHLAKGIFLSLLHFDDVKH